MKLRMVEWGCADMGMTSYHIENDAKEVSLPGQIGSVIGEAH